MTSLFNTIWLLILLLPLLLVIFLIFLFLRSRYKTRAEVEKTLTPEEKKKRTVGILIFVALILGVAVSKYFSGEERAKSYGGCITGTQQEQEACRKRLEDISNNCNRDPNCAKTLSAGQQLAQKILLNLDEICYGDENCIKSRYQKIVDRAAQSNNPTAEFNNALSNLELELSAKK